MVTLGQCVRAAARRTSGGGDFGAVRQSCCVFFSALTLFCTASSLTRNLIYFSGIFFNITGQHTNVFVTKTVDSSSIQRAETKYDLRIQFLALVVMIHEVWLNA